MRSIFFPIYVWLIEPAACYETETQITVSDHDKATCYFRGLLETASSTASFGRTSPRGRILTNTSKFVKVIASVECDVGILAILTGA